MKERKRERKKERQRDRETERQRDRETERQRDRETERQRDRNTERQKDKVVVAEEEIKMKVDLLMEAMCILYMSMFMFRLDIYAVEPRYLVTYITLIIQCFELKPLHQLLRVKKQQPSF